jgi:hypothetical protein
MKTVTITWKAFGNPTSATFEMHTEESALQICERAFRETNLYSGDMWYAMCPLMSEERTHTSLSVGDEVTVDGQVFRCEPEGWSVI